MLQGHLLSSHDAEKACGWQGVFAPHDGIRGIGVYRRCPLPLYDFSLPEIVADATSGWPSISFVGVSRR